MSKTATCLQCKKEFPIIRTTAKFCSAECRRDYNRGKPSSESTRAEAGKSDINQLLAARGLPPVILGSDYPTIQRISSGIPEIDDITGGGFPRGRITEIFGLKGVGKTTFMQQLIPPDLKVFYVDTENALVNVTNHYDVFVESMLERVEDAVDAALTSNKKYDLIVIDSTATLVPRAEVEGDAGDAHMGLKARLMSQWMRRITLPMRKSDAAVVFINQQRESMNPYGPAKFTPGGHGVPYAASLRLELKSNKADRFDGGHWVHVEIEKSRVCAPYQKTKFKLLYS